MNRFALFSLSFILSCISIISLSAQSLTDWAATSTDREIGFHIPGAPMGIPAFYFFGDGHFAIRQDPVHQYHTHGTFTTAEAHSVVPNVTSTGVYVPTLPSKTTIVNAPINVTNSSQLPGSSTNRQFMNGQSVIMGQSWVAAADEKLIYIISFTHPYPYMDTGNTAMGNIFLDLPHDVTISRFFMPDPNSNSVHNGWADFIDSTRTTVPNSTNTIDEVHWSFDTLKPGEIRHLYVEVDIPNRHAGTIITGDIEITADIQVPNSSSISYNNNYIFSTNVSGRARDPNSIEVDHATAQANISASQTLEYTVNFQNSGNYYAQNVVVDVNFNGPLLSALSVEMGDSKFDGYISDVTDNYIQFTFPMIDLPGSNQESPNTFTYDQTEGWFKFKFCTNNEIFENNNITADAAIYFDNEPPVFTNTALTEMLNETHPAPFCDVDEILDGSFSQNTVIEASKPLEVYPNPFKDQLNIPYEVTDANGAEIEMRLFSIVGQQQNALIFSGFQEQGSHNFTFDAQHLPGGTYILEIRNGQQTSSQRVIKMN